MTVKEALAQIKNKQFKNVYLLGGKEKFFHDQIINEISNTLFIDSSSRSLNRIILYGSENSLSEVVNACLSYPMMSDYKMVVVREFSKIKTSEAATFNKYLENPQKTNILILSAEDGGNTSFFKSVKDKAAIIDCKPISEYKITQWLSEYLQYKKIQMTQQAISMLAEYTGSNLLNIEQELRKVVEYKRDNSEITVDEIIAVTGMSKEYNVFTLQKALAEKNIEKSFLISKNLIDAGENVNLIVSILYSYFRKALIVANLRLTGAGKTQIMSTLKLSNFQFKEFSNTTTKFSSGTLEKSIELLHRGDQMAKNSAQDDKMIIQDLCYNICRL